MAEFEFFQKNNTGIRHLNSGHTREAIQCFREAFEQAKRWCHPASLTHNSSADIAGDDTTTMEEEDISPSTSKIWWPHYSKYSIIENLSSMASCDPREHGFVLILIPSNATCCHQDCHDSNKSNNMVQYHDASSTADMTLATAYVIYNLGLCYSMLGSHSLTTNQNGSGHLPLLTKARLLFESCRKLLLTRCESVHLAETPLPTANVHVDMLWLMLLVKLTEINYKVSNFNEARVQGARLNDFIGLIQLTPEYYSDDDNCCDKEVSALLQSRCKSFQWWLDSSGWYQKRLFPTPLAPAA